MVLSAKALVKASPSKKLWADALPIKGAMTKNDNDAQIIEMGFIKMISDRH